MPPEDIVEVIFAVSELGEGASNKQIKEFTDISERKVRESIKVLREINVIVGEEDYTLAIQYDDLVQQLQPQDRDALIEEALVDYQPFVDYASYINQGYSSQQASRKVNSAYDVAKSPEYLQNYLERLSQYAGIVSDKDELKIDIRNIPTDSTASVEELRDALESKLEVRVFLDEILEEEIMTFLDADTKNDLTEAFLKHSDSPRASISASGRALEDFLRSIGDTYGDDDRDYASASGIIPVCNHLQGDNLVEKIHKRRIFSFAEIRNKGGAHGDDAEKLERWTTTPEVSLTEAFDATLLIRSVYLYADREELIL
ncbi:hypothetical protein [Halosimplex sp. J119]